MNVAASPRSILNYLDRLEPSKGGKHICPVCGGNDLSINKQTGAFTCFNNGCDGILILDAIAPRTEKQKAAYLREKFRPKSRKELKKEKDAIATAQAWEVEEKAIELAHSFDLPLVSQVKLENEISEWAKEHRHDPFIAKNLLREAIQKLNPTEKPEETRHFTPVPLLSPEEWREDLEAVREREKTDAERYDELFDDRPLSGWIGEDAAQHYNTDFDSSNNIFVAAAWAHLTYLGALMPANLKTYKLPNTLRGKENISVNSIVFIAADRNGGKSTARGIVSKSFGEMVLSQIQSEWVKQSIGAKKDFQKVEKEEGGVREPSAYDSGCPRVEFGDTTIAALSKTMGVNEHYRKEYGAPSFGGLVTLDEGADFLNSNSMLEVKNKNPGFSFLNGAWSGTIAGRSRISTSESGNTINNTNLNFLLPLQTDKYEALVSHPSFASSGLNSRVVIIPLRKIANSQTDLPSLTLDEVMAKLEAPKTRNHYPNQQIIRAIGNVRRRLADQGNEVGWSRAAIAEWLKAESCFIKKSVDSRSEEATMRQRAYEDNVAKCAAMQAVSDAVYAPGASDFETPPFTDDANRATDAQPSQGIIEIKAIHVMRALDLCKLSLMAQLYFWEKTAPDRERAIAASTFTTQKMDWVGIFNDPAQLRDWVKGKQESGLDTHRKVRDALNGSTRKLLKQAGISAQEAIKAVWD